MKRKPRTRKDKRRKGRDRPTLSVCLMVGDDSATEVTLERALQSVHTFVDEVCVLWTGAHDSSSGKLSLCRTYADIYDEKPWSGHMAQMRNRNLAMATSDFILILDADEYVDNPGQTIPALYGQLTNDLAALELEVHNIFTASNTSNSDPGLPEADVTDRFWQIRILKNTRALRYEKSTHHQVYRSLQQYLALNHPTPRYEKYAGLTIMHTGYDLSEDERASKYGPRLVSLMRDITEATQAGDARLKAYADYQYGVGLYLAGQPRGSIAHLTTTRADLLSPDNAMYRFSTLFKAYRLCTIRGVTFDHAQAWQHVAEGTAAYHNPDLLHAAAHVALCLGLPGEAWALFAAAYTRADDPVRSVSRELLAQTICELMVAAGHTDLAEQFAGAEEDKRHAILHSISEGLEELV